MGGIVPFVVPNVHRGRRLMAGCRVGRCRRCRALGALPAFRRRGHPGGSVRKHARLGGLRRCTRRRPAPVGREASSSATGSTRPRRPRPAGASAHRQSHRRHCLLCPFGGTRSSAADVLGRPDEEARYAAPGRRRRKPRLRASTSRPAGRLMCDTETAYALAIAFDLLPYRRAAPARRGPAGRTGARKRLPHPHRFRRHAPDLRCAVQHRTCMPLPTAC